MASLQLPGEVHDLFCPEPGCSGQLTLKGSKYGPFYGCSRWRHTQCPGAHGAHPDGAPFGVPADRETKQARMRAHEAFDRLWKGSTKVMGRKQAYKWMQKVMELSKAEAHIGRFVTWQCEKLCQLLKEAPPTKGLAFTPKKVRTPEEEAERARKRTRKKAATRKRAQARKQASRE